MPRVREPNGSAKPSDNGQEPQGDAQELQDPNPDTSFETSRLESQPPSDGAPDPFDPSTYKVHQSLAAAAGVKEHLSELDARSPDAAWWVRRHPDPSYCLVTMFIELKEERETYLVTPAVQPLLVGEPTFGRRALYLAVTMQGKPFLWKVRLPADDTQEPDKWMKAPLDAVRHAKDRWTRIAWDKEAKKHRVYTCESAAEPQWPDCPMRDLVRLAFKDYLIDSMEHPVVRRLQGKAR
jgi:hypothetical protein